MVLTSLSDHRATNGPGKLYGRPSVRAGGRVSVLAKGVSTVMLGSGKEEGKSEWEEAARGKIENLHGTIEGNETR
ncbi:hypothetical protein BaRGS_00033015, partial [Batillaria attramentaria]